MRISDWSSDVCSSDLQVTQHRPPHGERFNIGKPTPAQQRNGKRIGQIVRLIQRRRIDCCFQQHGRSEEHTSELQSLMRISYAVFCLKKKTVQNTTIIQYVYTPQIHYTY